VGREATLSYRRFLKLLARKGFHKRPGETPLEFSTSLSTQPLGPVVAEFTGLYQEARYGDRPADTGRLLILIRSLEQWKPSAAGRDPAA
jgi:hypothetical protein